MSSRSGTKGIAAVVVIASAVAGCSEMYFDRRQTIALGAGDALATNKVTQMVDPWPAASANNNIAFNGQLMQSAQDRYNRGKVITPVLPTSASKDYQSMQSTRGELAVGDRSVHVGDAGGGGQGSRRPTTARPDRRLAAVLRAGYGVSDDDANWTVRRCGGQDAGRRADG